MCTDRGNPVGRFGWKLCLIAFGIHARPIPTRTTAAFNSSRGLTGLLYYQSYDVMCHSSILQGRRQMWVKGAIAPPLPIVVGIEAKPFPKKDLWITTWTLGFLNLPTVLFCTQWSHILSMTHCQRLEGQLFWIIYFSVSGSESTLENDKFRRKFRLRVFDRR